MASIDDSLSDDQLSRVLDKLAVSPAPHATLDALASIYSSWCAHVPFDNTRKLIHVAAGDSRTLPGDTPAEFFDAWLRWSTGGTCWAGNGALHALLCALGFHAERGVATMMVAPDLPPNHGTVVVTIDGRRYLVDASILHGEPLLLDDTRATGVDHPAWGVRCDRRDGKWFVRWGALHAADGLDCRYDYFGATAADFSERHEETRGWSPFNYAVNARRNVDGRVVGLAFGNRVEVDAQGNLTRSPVDEEQRRRVLIEEIGIHPELVEKIPADRPTPPIPGSRTASR